MTIPCVHWLPQNEHFEAVGVTHAGHRRANNEDSFAVDQQHKVLMVSDGIGGHQAGETASAMAITQSMLGLQQGAELNAAIWGAHQQTVHAAQMNKRLKDMGATLVCAQYAGPDVELSWVGDSRAYLFDADRPHLQQLTTDHTMLQRLLDEGEDVSPETARQYGHILTTAIGSTQFQPDHIEQKTIHWSANQLLLLCSDGLSDMLTPNQITNIMVSSPQLAILAERLLLAALAAGGHDNITLIIARKNHTPQL
ncbi:protein phosphatase 2C domain-containing protein [Neiella marina]|uniref:Protein phosphatase 2C domain-containing protein n=1 Tax=Neiella holothuriorum TaxID=2870530 RepID=A0ABS7EHB1_9GAMM|nr:protein phosphatase 2C domain-containing protein [Neiella holothuriorum]MBW8191732.1 protein phosphatase 2C domain-containing protein [Neiella holothuriorum]